MHKTAPPAQPARWQASRISEARSRVGLPQADFAELLGVSVRTLQDWEQGRRNPSGAAKTLLRMAILHPEILRDLPPWHANEPAATRAPETKKPGAQPRPVHEPTVN